MSWIELDFMKLN